MNVFACDESPKAAAEALADQHVVKMVLETAQILCTVHRLRGLPDFERRYRLTHKNHPVVRAALEHPGYLTWIGEHGCYLGAEYRYRFPGKQHGSMPVLVRAFADLSDPEVWASLDGAVACTGEARVPDGESPTTANLYRQCLREKYAAWTDAGRPPRWTNRPPPAWLE